jgi:hypothetical protein
MVQVFNIQISRIFLSNLGDIKVIFEGCCKLWVVEKKLAKYMVELSIFLNFSDNIS